MIVIIGNGISGVTAARHIRKLSDTPITIISSESKYFYSRTALMYIYMGHMKFEHTQPYEDSFWDKNDISLLYDHVNQIDHTNNEVYTEKGKVINYTKLIIASGSKPNKFGWKGQDLKGVQGLYSKQDLESMELSTKNISNAVVVGGGLIGVEMAEMLASRKIKVKFLVRETHFWGGILPKEDSEFVMSHLNKHPEIEMMYNTELDEIIGDNIVEAIKTKNGETIPCEFVGLAVGVSPNIDFLTNSGIETQRGILINNNFETSIPDIYAIGDCAEFKTPIIGRRNIEQVWYTGRIMGEQLANHLFKSKTEYEPGIWFNSAKFFDLEYQTYGKVSNVLSENEDAFIYTDQKSEIHLNFTFERETGAIIGVNTFGLRLRHLVFEKWIAENTHIEKVISQLSVANFDPEFYKKHEPKIIDQFNRQFNTKLKLADKKWWQTIIKSTH